MVEKHLLGQRATFTQGKQLQHLVFFSGDVHTCASHFDGLMVEIDGEIAGMDERLRMSLGAAHDRVNARNQLVLVERLRNVVVGTESKTLDLVLEAGKS